jgi:hypothetical protein
MVGAIVNATLDHVFICCSVGAPEADALIRAGLREGSANTHPGQGTACRRFFFPNAYLELVWVDNALEAQAPEVRPTRLWDRWSRRGGDACPYGIVFRPADETGGVRAPFASWSYRPRYMPAGLSIDIAEATPLDGPELFYLGFQQNRARSGQEPVDHALPIESLTGVSVWRPASGDSHAARALQAAGLVAFHDSDEYLLELRFGDAHRDAADIRPALPLVLRW